MKLVLKMYLSFGLFVYLNVRKDKVSSSDPSLCGFVDYLLYISETYSYLMVGKYL